MGAWRAFQYASHCQTSLDEGTLLEITDGGGGGNELLVEKGNAYARSRERPGSLRLRSRVASAATRGTELCVKVGSNGSTYITAFEGRVDIWNERGTLTITNGEAAAVAPLEPPRKAAALPAAGLIQWTFYYPGVLDLDELGAEASSGTPLAQVIELYRSGALTAALASWPAGVEPASPDAKLLRAALLLAAGQPGDAEGLLGSFSEICGQFLRSWFVFKAV